ncbi:MAG: hypothetical protein LYZ70_00090 [Nitrososphaerales archaeon]|nr:hypothetical protein [Nitrososphaerales archaeon]
MKLEPDLKPIPDEEVRGAIEFVRSKVADPVKFERWANDLLDRAHNVERKRRR